VRSAQRAPSACATTRTASSGGTWTRTGGTGLLRLKVSPVGEGPQSSGCNARTTLGASTRSATASTAVVRICEIMPARPRMFNNIREPLPAHERVLSPWPRVRFTVTRAHQIGKLGLPSIQPERTSCTLVRGRHWQRAPMLPEPISWRIAGDPFPRRVRNRPFLLRQRRPLQARCPESPSSGNRLSH
jgi:hypothetical protein